MKQLLFTALAGLFLSLFAHAAAVDSNGNGMTDAWERRFNGYELFPASILPGDDADGDGASNLAENIAGTNPFDGTPPMGFLQADVRHVSAVYTTPEGGGEPELITPEAFVISWPTRPGKQYTLHASPDLSPGSWSAVGEAEYGDGEDIEVATLPTYQDGTIVESFFWRVAVTDVDSDGDGFSDYDEWLKGTDRWEADRDDDGLPDGWETLHGLDPDDDGTIDPDQGLFGDADGDGLTNSREYWYHSHPNNTDTDADGLTDYEEADLISTDLIKSDTDGDGIFDGLEDSDYDGLTNLDELRIHDTGPRNPDTDGDRLRDGWEVAKGFDPLVYNDVTDPDGDGLANVQEQRLGLNPLVDDTDNDGTLDGVEDPDGDSLTNLIELNTHHTDPLKADTDNDGLRDDAEINTHLTNPVKHDTDGDGLPDGWEIQHSLNPNSTAGVNGASGDPDNDELDNFHEWLNGCDPRNTDTDGDGTDDLTEVTQGSDPDDGTDGGNPSEDEIQEVDFTVGGDYASWRMEIKGDGPTDRRTMFVNAAVGEVTTQKIKLHRNNKYKVTLHHAGSKEEEEETWYCWEAFAEDKPDGQTFNSYEPERIPGVAMFFTIGNGHWLVDNRDGLFTTHNHRTDERGGNATAGLEATLLPMETVVGDANEIADAPESFVAAEGVPTPSVEMTVTSSTLQDGNLEIRLQGTVRDSVSRFAGSAAERPQSLNFYHQDELLHSIALDETVGDGFSFDETVEIPNALPETYVIRAETTANIAGNKGYDESSVSLTSEEDASAFPALSGPLSIAFAAAPGGTTVDQATVYVGNGAPQTQDTASAETAANSLVFTGNLRIPAQSNDLTAPCQLKFTHPQPFSATEADNIVVHLEFTAPGFPKNHFYGRWLETGANTRIFRPGTWMFGNQVLKTAQTANRNLRGTPPSEIEAATIRFPSLPADLAASGLQVVSGSVAYDLINKGGDWYPEDPDEPGEIKRFMTSSRPVPARLDASGYDVDNGTVEFLFRYPGIPDFDAAEILVVPGEEQEEPSPPATTAARIYSLETASGTTPPPWQPGSAVIPEHVIWAYRFLNADNSLAIEFLDGYLRGGHQIETKDFLIGYLDLDVTLNDLTDDADNIWTIQIEEDINPIYAARLLFEGLKQASLHREVNKHYEFAHENGEWDGWMETEAFRTAMAEAVAETQQTAIAATEHYLSGLGIVNEGLDWIIIFNDVSEGDYESLAGALPFVPARLIKTGGFLKLRKASGAVTDALDSEGVEALKQLYRESDLRVMGVTMDTEKFSDSLRKALSTSGGPITPPKNHKGLREAMEALGPKPKGKFTAHHDFIWDERKWFAEHGIDVNNPAFGRWVTEHDHWTWHSGIGMGPGGRFSKEWKMFIAAEKTEAHPLVYTYAEIMDKLASMRSQFQVTGGND